MLLVSPQHGGEVPGAAREAGLAWPLAEDLHDKALERKLVPASPAPREMDRFVPDWAEVHRELERKG